MSRDEFIKPWERFKERLKLRWSGLSDQELDEYRGEFDLLCRAIAESFDESRATVQNFVDNLWFEVYVRGSKQASAARHL
jgi:broad specificity phosphatase PhoE